MCQCFTDSCLDMQANIQHHALYATLLNSSHNTIYLTRNHLENNISSIIPTNSHSSLRKNEIFKFCSNVLINSSIAIACGPYLDRDIMYAMDICISGNYTNSIIKGVLE